MDGRRVWARLTRPSARAGCVAAPERKALSLRYPQPLVLGRVNGRDDNVGERLGRRGHASGARVDAAAPALGCRRRERRRLTHGAKQQHHIGDPHGRLYYYWS